MTLDEAADLGAAHELATLVIRAGRLRDEGFGRLLTYSPKVFIPLTKLCRDVCHYCTFAKTPKQVDAPYLEIDEVLAIARRGRDTGCREALFTLGEKPELRYQAARNWLAKHGYASTVDYLVEAAGAVLRETGLIPHINAGTLSRNELRRLRRVSASMGIMVESGSSRLLEKGAAHHGSPDKRPWRRLATLVRAGQLRIPMTTGLLVGIGETREERLQDLLHIRRLQDRYGHIQEVIIQNFRAKADTRMAQSPEPSREELCWTIAMARLILGRDMSIQAPPNLSPGAVEPLVAAGINDWGGISPVTPDHVNPEAPWPEITELRHQCAAAGKRLSARLTIYPRYLKAYENWLEPGPRGACLAASDADGLLRDSSWYPGLRGAGEVPAVDRFPVDGELRAIVDRCRAGATPSTREIEMLFGARGSDFHAVCRAADELRSEQVGEAVSFVVNRNINYTNVCQYACSFCAFSKGRVEEQQGRERPYDIDGSELARRALEAWECGATEVCLQGGIHPAYTGETYLSVLRTLRETVPELHIHAFSPLEVTHGAQTLGLSLRDYLQRLREAGLATLPGTAAEILVDRVRAKICPDKLSTKEWLEVMAIAHDLGLRTTATMMFGHVDEARDWAEHLLKLRQLQEQTGGFTEFVPLPFVAQGAPMARRGESRFGPTLREAILVHAVARLVLGHSFTNIQTSWVKMGRERAMDCLNAGANDLGGTLLNESITRAAGAAHGQVWDARDMRDAILGQGRQPRMRRTDYRDADPDTVQRAFAWDGVIAESLNLPAGRSARSKLSH
ncbi:MAG: 5-amino-6-(D-ribitylamino)uracil--L-tyrosine 4-hydroxyphenyl transferase CofH [Pseudomonadota bacterium]